MESQIATGYAASNQGSTGAGAIIFDNSKDLELLQKNLGELDEIQTERLKMRKQAIANSQKFLTALNPDLEGIFPGDKDYIVSKTKELQQMGVGYLQQKNGANTQAQADLNNRKSEIQGLIEVSKARNKSYVAAIGIVDKDEDGKFDAPESHTAIARSMAMPLSVVAEHPEKALDGLVISKPADFYQLAGEYIKKNGVKFAESNIVHPKDAGANEIWINDVTANMTPGQMDDFSKNYRTFPQISQAADRLWKNVKEETPSVSKSMADPYVAAGLTPEQADQKAKDDFIHGKMIYLSAMNNKLRFAGLNEQGKANLAKLRAGLTEDKSILYDPARMYAGIMAQEPGANTAIIGVAPSQQTYREVVVDGSGVPMKDDNGKPVYGAPLPNVVTDVQYLPDGSVALRTSQTESAKSEANWQHYVDPTTGKISMDVKVPPVVFNKNQTLQLMTFMDANKTGIDINGMGKAFRKFQAVDGSGDLDQFKYIQDYSYNFSGGKAAPKKEAAKTTYKLTKEYNGVTYGRNYETDSWTKIK